MDPQYPLPGPDLADLADRLDADDRGAALDAVDRYDVELVGQRSRAGLADALADGLRPGDGAWAVDAVRSAARAYEAETGAVPAWVDAANYHDLPGLDRRVRPVWDHWGTKATYVDADRALVVQVPGTEPTVRGRLEQVLTWQHNSAVIADAGLTPVNDYDIVLSEIADEPVPVAVSAFHDELVRYGAMDPDQQADWYGAFERTAEALGDLIADGDLACANANDYWYQGMDGDGYEPSDIALDADAGALVVLDVGELRAGSWHQIEAIPYDTREGFLAAHGIDDRVDALMDRFGLAGD